MDNPEWKEFEVAVARFVKALDPNASVTHNVRLPDIHTGTVRQRDVWIEARVCQHFPIKALISCKKKKRRMDQGDIDAFIGELNSSGANLGVIYSYSGFSKNSIQKAKKLGISCCKLYQNEPPDIPDSIIITSSYCCTPRISISIVAPLDPSWNIKNWRDLFSLSFEEGETVKSVLDVIVDSYFRGEAKAKQNLNKDSLFPPAWYSKLSLSGDLTKERTITILIRGLWNIYEGQVEAYLLDGSYNFTWNEFIGSQSSPVIDLHGSHPGPGWKLLDEVPKVNSTRGHIKSIIILSGGNAKEALLNHLGSQPITVEEIDLSQIETSES